MAGTGRAAFVVGFTGETGKELVKKLATSDKFAKVVLIGRRTVEYDNAELQNLEQIVVDFEKLDENKEAFSGFDVGFCCLGTTRRAAGSAEAFRHVDYDYVHQVALNCKEGGTKHFHLVSSAGASKDSSFLYPKTKGQIEEACSQIPFERVSIYRPKFLLRQNMTTTEKFVKFVTAPVALVSPVTVHTACDLLAKAMVNNCDTEPKSRAEILLNPDIYNLGNYYNKNGDESAAEK